MQTSSKMVSIKFGADVDIGIVFTSSSWSWKFLSFHKQKHSHSYIPRCGNFDGSLQVLYRYVKCHTKRSWPGSAFIKPDQLDPWIKDQIKITLLPTISHLQLPNFVSCGRACPSHMTQNLVTVGAKLWTTEHFLVDPRSMDYADPVW